MEHSSSEKSHNSIIERILAIIFFIAISILILRFAVVNPVLNRLNAIDDRIDQLEYLIEKDLGGVDHESESSTHQENATRIIK